MNNDNDFSLPIIKMPALKKKVLTMDEYLDFVEFGKRNTLDLEHYRKSKRQYAVNVPFTLKE